MGEGRKKEDSKGEDLGEISGVSLLSYLEREKSRIIPCNWSEIEDEMIPVTESEGRIHNSEIPSSLNLYTLTFFFTDPIL